MASTPTLLFFAKSPLPIRDYELAVEFTYQAKIMPGFYIQPDFQYIFHPGYGRVNLVHPWAIFPTLLYSGYAQSSNLGHWCNQLQCDCNVSTTVAVVPGDSRSSPSLLPHENSF
jgi:Carbohydrate-selective porin, OprB family